jgi:uncharacterized protein YlxW (UPF0749 family)
MVVLVFVALGVLLGGQFKTQWQLRRSNLPRFARIEVLSEFYQRKVEENEKLAEEIQKLRQEMDQLHKDMAAGQSNAELLRKDLEQTKILAGLTAVEGPGVTVLIKDSLNPSSLEDSNNPLIVHYGDLVEVCNELKASGAEAIAINGQRIVAMSAIRCSGPVVEVNGTNIGSVGGYTIQAIGDPEVLEAGLNLPGGVVEMLRSVTIVVQIRQEKRVVVPALTVKQELRYAVPASEGTETKPGVSSLPSPSPSSRGEAEEGKAPQEREESRGGRTTEGSLPRPTGKGAGGEGTSAVRRGE